MDFGYPFCVFVRGPPKKYCDFLLSVSLQIRQQGVTRHLQKPVTGPANPASGIPSLGLGVKDAALHLRVAEVPVQAEVCASDSRHKKFGGKAG